MTDHWKHRATRCAVESCERTRVKGWSTCRLSAHYPLGQRLQGAGRIEPIYLATLTEPSPFCICAPDATKACVVCGVRWARPHGAEPCLVLRLYSTATHGWTGIRR